MARLCFDYGHGGAEPGACYKGRKECDDVLALGGAVAADVRRHGVIVDEIRTGDVTVSLRERSNFENENTYDYFISFHRNAYKPEEANGAETFVYLNPGEDASGLAVKLQEAMTNIGFANRGVKKSDFHVLRETKAPAVLVEMGFIDNSVDNSLFDKRRNELIQAISKAILVQLDINYQEESQELNTTLYRVMVGSYSQRCNAEKQLERLKNVGFDAVIMIYNK